MKGPKASLTSLVSSAETLDAPRSTTVSIARCFWPAAASASLIAFSVVPLIAAESDAASFIVAPPAITPASAAC